MLPEFLDNQHMNVVRLSALRTVRFYPSGNIPCHQFCYRLSRPHGCSGAGRIKSMKTLNGSVANRTRDLSACSAIYNVNSFLKAPLSKPRMIRWSGRKVEVVCLVRRGQSIWLEISAWSPNTQTKVFFCGGGGVRFGLEGSGFEPRWWRGFLQLFGQAVGHNNSNSFL